VLLNDVELRIVSRKIAQAERSAPLAAKMLDSLAFVPRSVVKEKNKTRMLLEHGSYEADERSLVLSRDKLE